MSCAGNFYTTYYCHLSCIFLICKHSAFTGEKPKKPIPLQEQTVKDEKGRFKRFHGAFTGGFSAGYFNTVGTKEGKSGAVGDTPSLPHLYICWS